MLILSNAALSSDWLGSLGPAPLNRVQSSWHDAFTLMSCRYVTTSCLGGRVDHEDVLATFFVRKDKTV